MGLVAAFLFFSARSEYFALKTNSLMKGVAVNKIMLRNFVALRHCASVQEAAELLLDTSQQDFPVLHSGQVVGLIKRDKLDEFLMLRNLGLRRVKA